MTPPIPGTTPTMPPAPAPRAPSDTARDESKFHSYVGHRIPWQVRLIWVIFWCFSAWYVIKWLLPALNTELLSPP